jgi:hypothetical protein
VASPSSADITEHARAFATAAIDALAEALQHPNERIAAAQTLLAVGWGQPVLPLTFDTSRIVIEYHEPHVHRANGEDRAGVVRHTE